MLFISPVVILALVTVMYLVSFWASSSSSRTIDKLSAYECGLEPADDAPVSFVTTLTIGFYYEWFHGALVVVVIVTSPSCVMMLFMLFMLLYSPMERHDISNLVVVLGTFLTIIGNGHT